jgi:uncharacterized protein DUF1570
MTRPAREGGAGRRLLFSPNGAKPLLFNIEKENIVKRLFQLLAALLLLAPAAAQAQWHEASSTHFVVYAEGNAESVRAFATKLERFDKGMRVLNGLADEDLGPANRLTIFVVSDIGAVRRLARGVPDIAGFYVARAGGSVAFTPRRAGGGGRYDLDAETILLHEYAHHFMMQNFDAAFPAWFVEGFAEFFSTTRFEKDGSLGFGAAANHRAYGLIGMDALPIEALLASTERKFSSAQEEATIYGRGWLLTHFLNFEPSRKGQLNAYLTALNSGKPSLEAARSAFGDLHVLDRELKGYLMRRRLSYLRIAPEVLAIGDVKVRPLTAGEAAIMPFRIQSERGVSEDEAKALVPRMRRAAAPFADDAAVQAALAEAEYDAGNYAEAEAAAGRALAAAPANIDALTSRARVAMARAEADEASDAATWREVRRRLIAANRADPNHPEPLLLFYQSFLSEGIEPTRSAVAGLLRAFELAPQDGGLRLQVARQYLLDRKPAEARAVLMPVAFNPHSGATGKAIQAIIVKLDESGADAALEAWDSAAAAEEGGEPEGPKKPKSTLAAGESSSRMP